MRIERLHFENFRNLRSLKLEPSPGVNVIWGANGQGKTNLLEGIYLFAYLKSFRGAGNSDLIGPQPGDARVAVTVRRSAVQRQLELQIGSAGRRFLLDGKAPRPIVSLLEVLRAVLFAPDELHQLRTLPAARRSLIDRAIFQLEPSYLACALDCERILRQRNRLLRERAEPGLIRPWTRQLIEAGAKVRQARSVFLESLLPLLDETQRLLSLERESMTIACPVTGDDLRRHAEQLAAEFAAAQSREVRMGMTCAGSHRDDPVFLLNGEPVRHFASQGQWRSMVLSFKIALLRLLHGRLGVPPLLLLDDMTAELDRQRQERLFALLAECGAQVFVTTTDPQPLRTFGFDALNLFQMTAGAIDAG